MYRLLKKSSPENMFIYFREKGREGERGKEEGGIRRERERERKKN